MGVYDQSKIGNAPSRGGSGGGVLKPPGYHASTVLKRAGPAILTHARPRLGYRPATT